ncbi:MAG: insulinase family protein [Ignavibacteriaceae bacterium]|nr:insulinase family protein [Ignavibacteriaceae bacterium]
MLIDRKKRPASYGEVNFTIPSIHSFTLSNGLKIFFSEKNELPIVRVIFFVNSGSRFDPDNMKGLCNLLTMCIDEGAGNYNALQLADEFEMLGAQFSVSCDPDVSLISLQVLTENFIPALSLISDVITRPHFNDEDFRREKNKALVRLNQVKAEPDYVADVSFEYFLFGKNCPYAFPVLGTEQTIQNIQTGSVKNLYKTKFAPSNSAMIVVGSINQDSLLQQLELVFRNWNLKSPSDQTTLNVGTSSRKVFIINKPDSLQTEIRVGHLSSKRNEKDFFHKQIINLVLGGQFSSRLNLNLREKHGYTYGVHSRFHYFREAGSFEVSTSVDVENTSNALREIHSEIIKFKDGISKVELDFAKSSLTKNYPSNFETYRQIAANIFTRVLHNLPDNYFETYIEKIQSVDLEDINKITNEIFYPDELTTVLVGDGKKIFNQLNKKEFGEVMVFEFDDLFNEQ